MRKTWCTPLCPAQLREISSYLPVVTQGFSARSLSASAMRTSRTAPCGDRSGDTFPRGTFLSGDYTPNGKAGASPQRISLHRETGVSK